MSSTLDIATDGLLQDGGDGGCIKVVSREANRTIVTPVLQPVRSVTRSTAPTVVRASASNGQTAKRVNTDVRSARTEINRIVASTHCGVAPPSIGGAGGGTESSLFTPSRENGYASPLFQGQPVCVVNGKWQPATSGLTRFEAVGFIVDEMLAVGAVGVAQTSGLMTLTIGQWDLVTTSVNGLVPETPYYLHPSGKISPDAPETVGAVVRVGYAINATQFSIDIEPPILL